MVYFLFVLGLTFYKRVAVVCCGLKSPTIEDFMLLKWTHKAFQAVVYCSNEKIKLSIKEDCTDTIAGLNCKNISKLNFRVQDPPGLKESIEPKTLFSKNI